MALKSENSSIIMNDCIFSNHYTSFDIGTCCTASFYICSKSWSWRLVLWYGIYHGNKHSICGNKVKTL